MHVSGALLGIFPPKLIITAVISCQALGGNLDLTTRNVNNNDHSEYGKTWRSVEWRESVTSGPNYNPTEMIILQIAAAPALAHYPSPDHRDDLCWGFPAQQERVRRKYQRYDGCVLRPVGMSVRLEFFSITTSRLYNIN